MTTASPLPTRVPARFLGAGLDRRTGYTYTPEAVRSLIQWLKDQPKIYRGPADPADVHARGHRSLQDLAGIAVRESLQYDVMQQAALGEIVLHPSFARVLEAVDQSGDEVRIEVEGTPICKPPGSRTVVGWKNVASLNFVAPDRLGWEHSVREADSPVDHAALKEWNREMDQRLYDNAPGLGVEHIVQFLPTGEVREAVQRRGYFDFASCGLIPTVEGMGPLAIQRGRHGAPNTSQVRETAAPVRESAASPRPRHSTAPQRVQQAAQGANATAKAGLQQALAVAQEGTRVMLGEDHSNVRDAGAYLNCAGYAVKGGDVGVAVHESVASGIWDYNLDASLGERARQPLDTASVRETNTGQTSRPGSGFVDPNRPYHALESTMQAVNEGVAQLFQNGQRGAGTQQGSTAGQALEDAVGQSLFGRTH